MSNESLNKGRKLEKAVESIERILLATNPSLKGAKLSIEGEKEIFVDGVKHQIDLFVRIEHGKGYNSTFIFECKNWKRNVGKNEIIIFEEKIKASKAQKGFFVAKEYTKFAKKQAKINKRVTLLYFESAKIDISTFPKINCVFYKNFKISNATFIPFGLENKKEKKRTYFDIKKDQIIHKGIKKSLQSFFDEICRTAANEKVDKDKVEDYPEGEYELELKKNFIFKKNDLVFPSEKLKKNPIRKLILQMNFNFNLSKPRITSMINVRDRGSVLECDPIKLGKGEIKISFVRISNLDN